MNTQNFLMRAFLRARFVMGSPFAWSLILGNAFPLLGYSIQSFFLVLVWPGVDCMAFAEPNMYILIS
jgi:hypothetical protein